MTPLRHQRAAYTLAVIANHHARTASQRQRVQPDTGQLATRPRSDVQWSDTTDNRSQNDTGWEAARQRQAHARGYAYVAPDASRSQVVSDCAQSIYELRTDGELARICGIGFKQYHLFQRYTVLHELTRLTGKQGFTRAEFDSAMQHYNVKGCTDYNTRLLKRGDGFYWRLYNGMVYPVGYLELTQNVIQHAAERGLHDLYLYGNHPGQRRDMYVNCNGSGGDFEAAILKAWYALHGNPTISRHVLEILLYRDSRSIRRMERRAGIRITFNEAQTTDPAAVPLKADGSLRGDVTHDKGVYSYRLPNTYSANAVRQHPYRGAGRKIARWFKSWLANTRLPGEPDAECDETFAALGKLNIVIRTYCETDRALKASRKRGNDAILYKATMRQRKGRVWDVDSGCTQAIYYQEGR